MRDYLSLPHAQPDTVQHSEMKWLSHAISGSLWQSSTLNQDTDFQATALIAKPSFQPRAKKWEQWHSESHPKQPDTRWAARWLWSVSHLGTLQQHRPQQVSCDLKVTSGLVLTHNTGTYHQCRWAEQTAGLSSPLPPKVSLQCLGHQPVVALEWLVLVQEEQKTWTALPTAAWREQRNKVCCSWKSTHYGKISQSWQEYYFD